MSHASRWRQLGPADENVEGAPNGGCPFPDVDCRPESIRKWQNHPEMKVRRRKLWVLLYARRRCFDGINKEVIGTTRSFTTDTGISCIIFMSDDAVMVQGPSAKRLRDLWRGVMRYSRANEYWRRSHAPWEAQNGQRGGLGLRFNPEDNLRRLREELVLA